VRQDGVIGRELEVVFTAVEDGLHVDEEAVVARRTRTSRKIDASPDRDTRGERSVHRRAVAV